MTIETAVPSSAEALAALFDQLVEAVAQRVKVHLTGPVFEAHVKTALDNIDIRPAIEAWAEDCMEDRLDHWATYKLDIEGDIDKAFRDMDISDMVKDVVHDLTFEVTVS